MWTRLFTLHTLLLVHLLVLVLVHLVILIVVLITTGPLTLLLTLEPLLILKTQFLNSDDLYIFVGIFVIYLTIRSIVFL